MDNLEKFLPIGSVVLLKNATKRAMIIGYLGKSIDNDQKTFDYIGCLYPEGVIAADRNLFFDHSNIDKIIFTGFSDESQKEFSKILIGYETIKEISENSDKKLNDNKQ